MKYFTKEAKKKKELSTGSKAMLAGGVAGLAMLGIKLAPLRRGVLAEAGINTFSKPTFSKTFDKDISRISDILVGGNKRSPRVGVSSSIMVSGGAGSGKSTASLRLVNKLNRRTPIGKYEMKSLDHLSNKRNIVVGEPGKVYEHNQALALYKPDRFDAIIVMKPKGGLKEQYRRIAKRQSGAKELIDRRDIKSLNKLQDAAEKQIVAKKKYTFGDFTLYINPRSKANSLSKMKDYERYKTLFKKHVGTNAWQHKQREKAGGNLFTNKKHHLDRSDYLTIGGVGALTAGSVALGDKII